jgi:hypothetical protein
VTPCAPDGSGTIYNSAADSTNLPRKPMKASGGLGL